VIDITRALATEGWMTEPELTYLAEAASKSRIIVEIGSWMGRSTCALAANVHEHVWAVDTWKGSAEHVPMLAGKPPGWLYEKFLANTNGLPVIPLMLPSMTAAALLHKCGGKADMIFIDANHTYESVKSDILAWKPVLAEGGILCGHDFDRVYWPGIVKAVEELAPNFRIVPNTTIWTTEAL
jgi:predicted O-methyltransferase YrrM